jgi:DNA-binding NarL/FixJ family response regulator
MRNILVIEDHPVVAEATKSLFESMGFESIEICTTAAQAVIKLEGCTDWYRIWIDIGIPGANGLSLVRHVEKLGFAEKSAVLTASEKSHWREEIESMGFLGYVVKTASVVEFNFALNEIMFGRRYFSSVNTLTQIANLTRRQTEILQLLHDGLRTKEIAKKLSLSPGSIDNQIMSLTTALQAKDRAHAVALGIKLGYVYEGQ